LSIQHIRPQKSNGNQTNVRAGDESKFRENPSRIDQVVALQMSDFTTFSQNHPSSFSILHVCPPLNPQSLAHCLLIISANFGQKMFSTTRKIPHRNIPHMAKKTKKPKVKYPSQK
jgi:hypothetical protein